MNILLAASECAPLVKVGGIADVIGSLPLALNKLSVDARVVLPFYKPLKEAINKTPGVSAKLIKEFEMEYNHKNIKISVYEYTTSNGIRTFLIDNEEFISNGGVYYSPDTLPSPELELIRFAIFSKAIVHTFMTQDVLFVPDVIHCNDWHTGLVPQLMRSLNARSNKATKIPTVFTIHNLAYQGFSSIDVADNLGLDITRDQLLRWDSEDNNLDFLLQGIVGSTLITTVSEKYAEEIQTPQYGEGLHEILQARKGRLSGIINGISYEVFNPQTDTLIKHNYTKANWHDKKTLNKKELQAELGLEASNKPMLGIISRLAQQKGLDVVAENLEKIVELGYQVVLLGSGDPLLESRFKEYNANPKLRKNYVGLIEFSEQKARQIYASSDMFLVPSRYEPCGLTQMIAMRYGSVPVVRATGGLFDTVEHDKTGFLFTNLDSKEMLRSLALAQNTYKESAWHKIVANAMSKDFSWNESAKKYIILYKKALSI
jgi:starch synthase